MSKKTDAVLDQLLSLYDWHIRLIDENRDDYSCGYADAIAQAILDVSKILGDTTSEAYKRVWHFETVEKYKQDYPKPITERINFFKEVA